MHIAGLNSEFLETQEFYLTINWSDLYILFSDALILRIIMSIVEFYSRFKYTALRLTLVDYLIPYPVFTYISTMYGLWMVYMVSSIAF